MERMDDNLPTAALVPAPGQVDRTILLFDKLESTIGRDNSCDHRIVSMQVSRKHATIKYENDSWWIYDMQSTNGILVQGIQIEPGEISLLEDGYTVCFGPAQKSEFKYIFHENYSPFCNVKHSSSLIRENAHLRAKLTTLEAQLKRQKEYNKLISDDIKMTKRVCTGKVAKYHKKIRFLNSLISKYRTLSASLPKDSSSNDDDESKHDRESHFGGHAAVLSMLREVTCPICSEYLVSPTSLNCSHVFCQHCIDTWKNEYCQAHNSRDAICPVCRKKMQFQTQPRAFENLIDILLGNVLDRNDLEERSKLVEARKKKPLVSPAGNGSSSSLDHSFAQNLHNIALMSRTNSIQHNGDYDILAFDRDDEDEDVSSFNSLVFFSELVGSVLGEISGGDGSGDDVEILEDGSESIVLSESEE